MSLSLYGGNSYTKLSWLKCCIHVHIQYPCLHTVWKMFQYLQGFINLDAFMQIRSTFEPFTSLSDSWVCGRNQIYSLYCRNLNACCVLYSYCCSHQGQFCFAVPLWCSAKEGGLKGALWLWLWLIWCLSPRISIQLHTICRPHSGPSERGRDWRGGERNVVERGAEVEAVKGGKRQEVARYLR